ncbi:MAG: DUF6443 domain-containing protein [Bacteroidota bacterium]
MKKYFPIFFGPYTRFLFLIGACLLGGISGEAQVITSDKNYVHEVIPQQPVTINNINQTGGLDDVPQERHRQSVTYYDGLGRHDQTVVIQGGGTVGQPESAPQWVMDWTTGSGGTSFYNRSGSATENQRLYGSDPHGKKSILWKCGNDSNADADGGWNTDDITVDKNKAYRYSVWVKRTGSQNGATYHGTQNVNRLNGSADNNPFFWSGDLPSLGEWYLMVGVIHPHTHGTQSSGISGVYDRSGNKRKNGKDFKWRSTTTTTKFRDYLSNSTDTNVRQYFYQPLLEVLDGTELSIAALVAGPQVPDMVGFSTYDDYGRKQKEHLPYPVIGQHGRYAEENQEAATQKYHRDYYSKDFSGAPSAANAFSEIQYEASPMNRVLKQAAPGSSWKMGSGHEVKMDYQGNIVGDQVKRYQVSLQLQDGVYTPSLTQQGTYAKGALYKNVTRDENWTSGKNKSTEEFTNKEEQVVLKRSYNEGKRHDTYYIYDDHGNLTYVLPPKMEGSTANINTIKSKMNSLGYQYVYDQRDRLVRKKVPGKGWEEMVYNKLDLPILTQDANLKAQNKWLFTKYDAFGRVVYTGLLHSSASRAKLQTDANNATGDQWVKAGNSTLAGKTLKYTKGGYPTSGLNTLHTITYYDSYQDTDGLSRPTKVLGENTTAVTKGLETVQKVKVLETNKWITTLLAYDKKGRVIHTATKNTYLNTTDVVQMELDFGGKVLRSVSTHTKTGKSPIVVADFFKYDQAGRVTQHTERINNGPSEVIAANRYNAKGELIQKGVGNTEGKSRLQVVDYTYNLRGWLTAINDPNNLGNDLFAFGVKYNTVSHGGTPLFNGNISETEWRTGNSNNNLKWYRYKFDALNRLTGATDNSPDKRYSLSNLSYDKNGNVIGLKRRGHLNEGATSFGNMDVLSYIYDSGNKVLRINDSGNDTYGFKDGVNTNDDFKYDANGNLEIDRNKGINSIAYNHLNMPTLVDFGTKGNIAMVYAADGTKLKKTTSNGTIMEYANGYVYLGGQLQFFNHPEGYVLPEGNSYRYVYQFKDHVDNIRLSYTEDPSNLGQPTIIEENNYYPFGGKIRGYNMGGDTALGNDVAQKWKFGGMELDESLNNALGTYDFGARMYNPWDIRWWSMDPITHYSMSPYNAFDNNPAFWADPTGADAECPSCQTEDDWNLYYSQARYTANATGQKIVGPFVLGEGPLSSSLDEDGHTLFYLNGELQDLNKHDNMLDALSSLVADGLMPEAPVRVFKFLGGLFKGGGDEVAEVATNVSDDLNLLPNELEVGTYDDLINAGTKGDNLTPHHMPSADFMKSKGISKGDGVAMNMEQPHPGAGGRHRQTASYGRTSDKSISARLSLARDIKDARNIYMKDGLYGTQVRDALQNVVKLNVKKFPNLFNK